MPKMPKKLLEQFTPKKPEPPLWKGPHEDGITFSMLTRFLSCRERFRVRYIEGLKPVNQFNHRIEFGSMWHVCEEAFAKGWEREANVQILTEYARDLSKKYPTQQEAIRNWYEICRLMFPIYVQYWSAHPDVTNRTPLMQEQVFDVPYLLPSGRTVRLRGKWDSVDLVGGKDGGIFIQENKTKGEIDLEQTTRQMGFDLQTMIYMVALEKYGQGPGGFILGGKKSAGNQYPLRGVRYNVVKRPRQYQGKKETREEFHSRLQGIVQETPQDFFMRLRTEITSTDIARFKERCLNPILEQVCDWYDWVAGDKSHGRDPFKDLNTIHWQHPFGSINYLDEGGSSDVDSYLTTGSKLGLVREEKLFSELQ